ncbi:protein PLASTID MOVEMENT IMPAIRED 1 [Henckelia pumila]|uniref:protein PLASTID MOVEMENT IMPAIRED 1 n=1 Tax=Henckelia pumila TaxID=405737 RepID=UPI003C6E15AD
MAADYPARRNSNTQILQELEELSETMYQSHSSNIARRTASLAIPRTAIPAIDSTGAEKSETKINPKPRTRRMSLSPWRSRQKIDEESEQAEQSERPAPKEGKSKWTDDQPAATSEKKGIWNWKPMRALSHIGMQKLSCLFSVEVVAVQGLPASMNGLRMAVCVRKKETKEGAVQTMPSRVAQGVADFEETLFMRCHVYFTPGSGTQMKFEPRPFLIYVGAVDADELDFGKSTVDLSNMIQESVDKSFEGNRVRQWDSTLNLSGKAKGGALVLKLGFQIMEKDGGLGIYNQPEGQGQKPGKSRTYSPSIARKQSKSSFSIPSPRMSSRAEAWTPSQTREAADLQGIDELNLDEPAPPPPPLVSLPVKKSEVLETKMDDNDIIDFDVEDKGVEFQDKDRDEEEQSEENSDKVSFSSEVVKEVVQVQDQPHITRFTELDLIAQQIKALESMMEGEKPIKTDEETMAEMLDADEDKVTREFLQMLEDADDDMKVDHDEAHLLMLNKYENTEDMDSEAFLPDLGKGLGCVVQTRNGGYLAAMNPLDTAVARKDAPKLAMQISKPLVLQSNKSGFELFQKMAAIGLEELTSEILSLMPLDELKGKTAEQIAFEGIASQIIQGRNKEGASSSAARSIAALKSIGTALNSGRKERFSTGIWTVSEEPLTVDEILAFSMQKIENMTVDGLKIQADIAEEDAPFDVSPLDAKTTAADGKVFNHLFDSAIPIEDWMKQKNAKGSDDDAATITMSVVVQLRDPMRQYEAVGGPMIALIHAPCISSKPSYSYEENKYKVTSLQVGGIKMRTSGNKTMWDDEKQRLTSLQWLVAYGLGKAGKRAKSFASKGPDLLWSISSRVMADMWLKPIRNPDVKFTK